MLDVVLERVPASDAQSAQPGNATQRIQIPMDRVVVGKYNPRRGKKAVAEMAESIRAQGGVLQAPLVRPIGEDSDGPLYELVYGQRRYLGAQMVYGATGVIDFDCRQMSDAEAVAASAAENIDREDMTPIEEAEAAAKVLAEFDGDRCRAAKRMGWSPSTLDARLKLMACSQAVRDAVVDERVGLGVAELLAGLLKVRQDEMLASLLGAEKMPTIDDVKAKVMVHTKNLGAAIFNKADCATCVHNSAIQGEMFGTFSGGHCLNASCFDQKLEAELEGRAESLRDTYPVVRVVRAGDQLTVRKIFIEGDAGVGEEQASACRGCANFGAAVSSIPEKLGLISRNLCFSPACNDEKIKAYRQQREAQAAQVPEVEVQSASDCTAAAKSQESANAADAQHDNASSVKSATKQAPTKVVPKPTVKLSPVVVEHRLALYRTVIAREILKAPERGNALLMALGATGKLRTVPENEVSAVLASLTGSSPDQSKRYTAGATSVAPRFKQALALEPRIVASCLAKVAATCVSGLDGQDLEELVKALAPEWKDHFKLDAEFLGKLTKVEIMGIASELGIGKLLGDKVNGLMNEKKDKLIATVLGAADFEYQGAIPRVLLPGTGKGLK